MYFLYLSPEDETGLGFNFIGWKTQTKGYYFTSSFIRGTTRPDRNLKDIILHLPSSEDHRKTWRELKGCPSHLPSSVDNRTWHIQSRNENGSWEDIFYISLHQRTKKRSRTFFRGIKTEAGGTYFTSPFIIAPSQDLTKTQRIFVYTFLHQRTNAGPSAFDRGLKSGAGRMSFMSPFIIGPQENLEFKTKAERISYTFLHRMTTAGPRTFYRGLKTEAEKISFTSPLVRPQQDMTKAQKDIFPTFLHHHSRSRTFYRGLKTEAEKTSFTSPFVRQTTADLEHSIRVSKRKLKGYLTRFLLLGGRHDRRTEHLSGHTSFRWRCTRHPHLHFPTIHHQCKPNTQKPIHV